MHGHQDGKDTCREATADVQTIFFRCAAASVGGFGQHSHGVCSVFVFVVVVVVVVVILVPFV